MYTLMLIYILSKSLYISISSHIIMKRKIVQHGSSTLTISLPSKWAKYHNLKKGDELEILQKDEELIIKGEGKEKKHEISIDITKLESSTLVTFALVDLFMKGYKKIRIKYNPSVRITGTIGKKELDTLDLIKSVLRYMMGVEITEDKPGMCVIEEITNLDASTFKNTFRRGFLLLLENAEYIEHSKPKDISKLYEFERIYFLRFYHPDKFFQYCIKLLKVSDMPKHEKERYLLLLNNLKIIGHFYARIGEMKKRLEITQGSLVKVNNVVRNFYSQIFNPKINELNRLSDTINYLQFELMKKKNQDTLLVTIVNILKQCLCYLPLEELVKVK